MFQVVGSTVSTTHHVRRPTELWGGISSDTRTKPSSYSAVHSGRATSDPVAPAPSSITRPSCALSHVTDRRELCHIITEYDSRIGVITHSELSNTVKYLTYCFVVAYLNHVVNNKE